MTFFKKSRWSMFFKTTATLLMVLFVLSACAGGKNEPGSTDAQGNNNEKEQEKLSSLVYWAPMAAQAAATMKSYNEIETYKELEQITGVKVDFQHPPQGQEAEQFSLMISADKLPDVIEYTWNLYPGGPEKALKDGKIIDLKDLIEEYAPNFKKILDENPESKKQLMTDDGSIIAFPFIRSVDEHRIFYGPVVRQDWLDYLKLDKPETLDEWYSVLKAFKEGDPNQNGKADEIPLYISEDNVTLSHMFIGAFGIANGFYQENGVVKYGPVQPEYKEFLAYMNKLYTDGLLDKDFAVTDGKIFDAKMTGNQVGAAPLYVVGGLGKYMNLMTEKQPEFKLEGIGYPVKNKGEKPQFGQRDYALTGHGAAISSSNKNIVETVKWLDFAYSEEGNLLFNFGKEGVSYTMEDGLPKYLPEVLKDPNGLPLQQSQAKHNRSNWNGPFVSDVRNTKQGIDTPEMENAKKLWSVPTGEKQMPLVTPSREESSKYSSIMTDINTYKSEMYVKFIIGTESLDQFDKFVKTLESMGIAEATQIQQAALDRYNKR